MKNIHTLLVLLTSFMHFRAQSPIGKAQGHNVLHTIDKCGR